ncbi:MAG: tetratricopeptide repeat protein [Phycisphaerae bacterium]
MDRKRRQKFRKRRKKRRDQTRAQRGGRLPDCSFGFAAEKMMLELDQTDKSDPEYRAQMLYFAAMESGDPARVLKLLDEALGLDPDCVDALRITVEIGCESRDDLVEGMQNTVQIAEEKLGKEAFEDDRGHFWGVVRTRPYMRARSRLAKLLCESGRFDEAAGHFLELLELDPHDHIGSRYRLLEIYLQQSKIDDAHELLSAYEDDPAATWQWGWILTVFLLGDEQGAADLLALAREDNPFVENYFTGRRQIPDHPSDSIRFGGEDEAQTTAFEIGAAWKAHPRAVQWLRQQTH